MGRFDTTKATINANIKSNGNQEITGSVLNSVLQEMVDGTDAQLTELSGEIVLYHGIKLPYGGKAYEDFILPTPLREGMVITDIGNAVATFLKPKGSSTYINVYGKDLPYTIQQEIVAYQVDVTTSGEIKVEGVLEKSFEKTWESINNLDNQIKQYFGFTLPYGGKAYEDYIPPFSLREGMVITDIGISETIFLKPKGSDSYIDIHRGLLPYTIQQEIVAYQVGTTKEGEIKVEGTLYQVEDKFNKIDSVIAPLVATSFKYGGAAYVDLPLPYNLLPNMVISDIGVAGAVFLKPKEGEGYINVYQSQLPYTIETEIIAFQADTAEKGTMRVEGIINGYDPSNADGGTLLSNDALIVIPKPQLAYINLITPAMPTSKTDDIKAEMEFDDRQGNRFKKKLIINAQGTSSLGLPKKNISIDIMDENYDDSHSIKFGDWVAQDGFHLKAYMLDGMRVKPMAAYDFYESMLLTRGTLKDRLWKRMQLPSDISATSNAIDDLYMQIDDGARCHPVGFPCILSVNGEFYGIYCWQLKKHRDNYHQKKDNAGHIHLDGNISNILLWEANGVINWNKWAGKEMESDATQNNDGIEIRNPKKLILVDGSEYDADTNTGELISDASANYNPSNKDMVRTASVRANIESLSRRVYSLTQMSKGAEKKAAIAEVFDVDSIIDFIIFGQITGNADGYKKNWQWVSYDGVKWGVNAYDLDGVWGWDSWSYFSPFNTWLHNDTPPITLIIENYLDEIKARYKELRDKGVIDIAKIMQPLVNYVKIIGKDNYELEYDKWADGARDNLWRFQVWMEESIKRTDALMSYNS